MNNKTTIALLVCTIGIFTVIGIGFISSQPKQQTPPAQTSQPREVLPSERELENQLITETPAIQLALAAAFPTLEQNYTIERPKLYNKGEWYGAILQYKGSDVNNRDTLRIVLKKKNDTWTVRTPKPQPLVNSIDISDAPQKMLDDINKPAPLIGTPTSPAITPNE